MMIQADHELDLSGLNCPMPLLKTKQALNKLESGKIILVHATDPGSERDFQVFSTQSGIALLHMENHDGVFHYWLQKP